MIGIDIELPKSCGSCHFLQISSMSNNNDVSGLCYDLREYVSSTNENPKDCRCRLVDLGKEDMSWEELVEKVKELKSDLLTINEDYIRYRSFAECWDCLEFGIDNQIVFKYMDEQKVIHTDKSFFQMYQIIKSLVGDER